MKLGKEQFRDAFTEFRNLHIAAAIQPLIVLRQELTANDEFMSRGGTDSPTRDHLIALLQRCDLTRRHVTHNPDSEDLGTKIARAIDPNADVEIGENPFGGDDIQNQSGGLIALPWALDGSDVNIPLASQLSEAFRSGQGGILLGAIDRAIVGWTRMNSRNRTRFVTRYDSMRIYGNYQEILGYLKMYLGDENRVDVAQVLPSEEPRGPVASPNLKVEELGSNPPSGGGGR